VITATLAGERRRGSPAFTRGPPIVRVSFLRVRANRD